MCCFSFLLLLLPNDQENFWPASLCRLWLAELHTRLLRLCENSARFWKIPCFMITKLDFTTYSIHTRRNILSLIWLFTQHQQACAYPKAANREDSRSPTNKFIRLTPSRPILTRSYTENKNPSQTQMRAYPTFCRAILRSVLSSVLASAIWSSSLYPINILACTCEQNVGCSSKKGI